MNHAQIHTVYPSNPDLDGWEIELFLAVSEDEGIVLCVGLELEEVEQQCMQMGYAVEF